MLYLGRIVATFKEEYYMWSLKNRAELFLAHLSDKEKQQLHNELLAVQQILSINQQTSFYLFSPFKKGARPHYAEEQKRVLQFQNERNDELIIHQIHRQSLFKHTYSFRIYFNLEEMDFSFLDDLLHLLKEQSQTPTFKLSPAVN
ncbi:hypothetical protein [Enterococcus casseliflavus]|uniref:hypothetical protein n=1 Tax=Enterococcus casseliflavus TaxID=37734 RepID=UPI00188460B4|nr:hypothetical protein [Enterococcus casseliflavus]MBE9908643.1 hypothetical protein [Enterococcus casseliflavus]